MRQNERAVSAYLVNGNQRVPITAKYASKYSLWISFQGECEFATDDRLTLIVQNNGDRVELGPCRLISDPEQKNSDGRLVFVKDLYDTLSLFSKHKAVKLKSAFQDLPALLARKEKIKHVFKEFTLNLTYDLAVYKNLFDQLDSDYCSEPPTVQKAVQTAIINNEGTSFKAYLDNQLVELENQVSDFSIAEHQVHGFFFRKQIWDFLICSPFMARCNLKPRGFAGDSEIMRMIYLNDYQGESTFSKVLHKHGLEHAASQSVRNRISLITRLLADFQKKERNDGSNKASILNVACGPAFELKEIFTSSDDCHKFHFSLLDSDPKALSDSTGTIESIEGRIGAKLDVELIRGSVRTILFSKSLKQKWIQYDFIYSLGLMDYLSTRIGRAVISKLYQMLKPGGEMIIGNFHTSNASRVYMEYWFDWVLNLRTENDLSELAVDIPAADRSIFFEDTGSQMFLHLRKPAV